MHRPLLYNIKTPNEKTTHKHMHSIRSRLKTNHLTKWLAIACLIALWSCNSSSGPASEKPKETISIYTKTRFAACFDDRPDHEGRRPCFAPDESHNILMLSYDRHDLMAELEYNYDETFYVTKAQWYKIKCEYYKWLGVDLECSEMPPGIHISEKGEITFKSDLIAV